MGSVALSIALRIASDLAKKWNAYAADEQNCSAGVCLLGRGSYSNGAGRVLFTPGSSVRWVRRPLCFPYRRCSVARAQIVVAAEYGTQDERGCDQCSPTRVGTTVPRNCARPTVRNRDARE